MDGRIEKALDYLESNLGKVLSLEELATVACLSPSQFHRLFKKETQNTPFKFAEKIKMNHAYQAFIQEKVSVQQMAIHLGYNDYETFSRAFKKHFFVSPDDLKSIAGAVNQQLNPEEQSKMILTTMDNLENYESVIENVAQILKKENLSFEELKEAKIFVVKKGADSSEDNQKLIKNKYELKKDEKIWEMLIRNRANALD